MAIKNEIQKRISTILRSTWEYADARMVPETKSIRLGNHGKKLRATVLYADIDSSTALVGNYKREFSAEIYKCFLYSAARIIVSEGGEIRSFDGDRVMGIFKGDSPNTNAVRTALKINFAMKKIVNPEIKRQYPNTNFVLKHTVGVDISDTLVVRGGVRDSNDLMWIGNAANIAAKLNSLPSDYATWITGRVFDGMSNSVKIGGNPKREMWGQRKWTAMNDLRIYCSSWTWAL